MEDDYKQVEMPTGARLERCPCCHSDAQLWRYAKDKTSPVEYCVMCIMGEKIGPQDSVIGSGCPLYMPDKQFYQARIADAIKYWNRFAIVFEGFRAAIATPAPDKAAFMAKFGAWWEQHGQFVRAGGGDYEKPCIAWAAWEYLAEAGCAAPAMQAEEEASKVVVTKNEAGQIVAVTRNDLEGRIIAVIAESAPLLPQAPAPQAEIYRLAEVALRECGDEPIVSDWQVAAMSVCRLLIADSKVTECAVRGDQAAAPQAFPLQAEDARDAARAAPSPDLDVLKERVKAIPNQVSGSREAEYRAFFNGLEAAADLIDAFKKEQGL